MAQPWHQFGQDPWPVITSLPSIRPCAKMISGSRKSIQKRSRDTPGEEVKIETSQGGVNAFKIFQGFKKMEIKDTPWYNLKLVKTVHPSCPLQHGWLVRNSCCAKITCADAAPCTPATKYDKRCDRNGEIVWQMCTVDGWWSHEVLAPVTRWNSELSKVSGQTIAKPLGASHSLRFWACSRFVATRYWMILELPLHDVKNLLKLAHHWCTFGWT